MKYLACGFLGHREVNITEAEKTNLSSFIEHLIKNKNVTRFLFGSKSKFIDICYNIVLNKKHIFPNIEMIYFPCTFEEGLLHNEKEKFTKINKIFTDNSLKIFTYDKIIRFNYFGKSQYVKRNQTLIDYCDICIFYYIKSYKPSNSTNKSKTQIYSSKSGTELAFNYAKRKNKIIFNMADNIMFKT